MSQYDQFVNEQESKGRQIYDFWSEIFRDFNPRGRQSQPVDTMPSFQGGADEAVALLQGRAGAGTGNLDVNRLSSGIRRKATQRGLHQNLANYLSGTAGNASEAMRSGMGGRSRMNFLSGIQDKVNQLPMDRYADNLAMRDTIKSMNDAYKNSKGDLGNIIGGGIGDIVGLLAGSGGGRWDDLPLDFSDPFQSGDYLDPEGLFAPPLPSFG